MQMDEILQWNPYELDKKEKSNKITQRLRELSIHHINNCSSYNRMMKSIHFVPEALGSYEELPFLPVRLFKEMELKSIREEEVFKTMTSSGTSGQAVSKIYLDRNTAGNQQKVLTKIVSEFTGSKRMPMLIIDSEATLKNRYMFSARGAGILGFSIFGTDRTYALDENMKLDVAVVKKFLDKHAGERIFVFGFTFMIWEHFYKELLRLKEEVCLDLSNGVMIHGGGWKKLQDEAVISIQFKKCLNDVCGLQRVHDYYGMVEQTGCIYMECEQGHLHTSIFSDVLIRNPKDFSVCACGEKGIIQVVSVLPESYPGHSLLTEDEGVLLGEDDCPCGRKGKYFQVLGRLKNAELRGCSDTYATTVRESS